MVATPPAAVCMLPDISFVTADCSSTGRLRQGQRRRSEVGQRLQGGVCRPADHGWRSGVAGRHLRPERADLRGVPQGLTAGPHDHQPRPGYRRNCSPLEECQRRHPVRLQLLRALGALGRPHAEYRVRQHRGQWQRVSAEFYLGILSRRPSAGSVRHGAERGHSGRTRCLQSAILE